MRLSRADLVPVLAILTGGAAGVCISGSLLLSRADDAPSATVESTVRYVAMSELIYGSPERVVALDGNSQIDDRGEVLPDRLWVMVADEAGNPVPGVQVRFRVESGGGRTTGSRARTDALGQTSASWRLGMEAGTQELTATVEGIESVVTFTATARARPTLLPYEGPRFFCTGRVGGVAVCRANEER